MSIESWWPKLAASDQAWLIQHNGEPLPPEVLKKVTAVGGLICTPPHIVGYPRPDGFHFSDETIDRIEAIANGEMPSAS